MLVQVLAYGKVNDARVRKKMARAAAKAEKEKRTAEKDYRTTPMTHSLVAINRLQEPA